MANIGIMQGRLTEPRDRGIQFFPFDNWTEEFVIGRRIGIDEIEWIFDYYNYKENPLWTASGCERIIEQMKSTGVSVNAICWDYFMRRPFYKDSENENDLLVENKGIARTVLSNMKLIGAKLLEIPLVDDSSIKNEEEKQKASEFITYVCEEAQKYGITIGLETDFPPIKFRTFLDGLGINNLYANYDSGNSSGLGYNHIEELTSLDKYVRNVHIKDRIKGNGTVSLGTGSANFDDVFSALKKIGYSGGYILQAARGEDGDEAKNITKQIIFVKQYLEKYGLE